MKCSYLTLSQYLDGELEPAVTGEVDAHIVGCERCHTALDMMRSEAKRIRQLVHIHATDDVVRHLFVELDLQDSDAPLPDRKVSRAVQSQNESLPWLRAETNGAALPWSPDSPSNPTSNDDLPHPPAEKPDIGAEDESHPSALSDQHGDPSSLPVPSSSPSPTEEGSHAVPFPTLVEPEPPIDLPGNPRSDELGKHDSHGEERSSVTQEQAEPMSEWGALHLHDSAAQRVATELLEQEHSTTPLSPWRPPTIATKPSVLEDGPTTPSPRPSTVNLLPHAADSEPAVQEGQSTEKKTAFLGMDEDDESEVVLLQPGIKEQIRFRLQALMPRFARPREDDAIETVHGIGAPQERVHSAARRLLQQGSSAAGRAVHTVERAVSSMQKSRAESSFQEDDELPVEELDTARPVRRVSQGMSSGADLERKPREQEDLSTGSAENGAVEHLRGGALSISEGRHASAVAAHRKSRSTGKSGRNSLGNHMQELWKDRAPGRLLQIVGGMVVLAVLSATLVLVHRNHPTGVHHQAVAAVHHAASVSTSPAAPHPTATSAPHAAQQIALTNVETIGSSTAPVEIQDLRYGQHAGYYRVVFDLTGSTESQVTLGTDASTGDVIVVIKDARPVGQPAPLSETTTITSVHMIPPSTGVNETVYEFSVAKPVTLRPAYLLGPTRLIVDFIPQ